MTHTTRLLGIAALAFTGLVHTSAQQAHTTEPQTQAPPPPPAGRGAQPAEQGPPPANFPQQQRAAGDPALIERGKALYQSTCAACHGIDLRGGQQGGPNLLRSQTLLSDKHGELIEPIVKGGRPNPPAGAPPMPPFPLPSEDIRAISEYLHSVLAQAGAQGQFISSPFPSVRIHFIFKCEVAGSQSGAVSTMSLVFATSRTVVIGPSAMLGQGLNRLV